LLDGDADGGIDAMEAAADELDAAFAAMFARVRLIGEKEPRKGAPE